MLIEVNLTQLIFIVTALFSGLWVLFKSFWVSHEKGMDKRFTALLETMNHNHQKHMELERELLRFQSDVSNGYLRREEYLRDIQLLRDAMQRELEPLTRNLALVLKQMIEDGSKRVIR